MRIESSFQSGVQGVNASMSNLRQTAHEIATNINTETAETSAKALPEHLVDLTVYELSAKASIEVIRTTDDMLGHVLDMIA